MVLRRSSVASSKLRIILDSSEPWGYTADDPVVRGKVVFQSDIDEAVGEVSIQFIGRYIAELYKDRWVKQATANRDLFNETQHLYDSHYTIRANTSYEWPFTFVFPSHWSLSVPPQNTGNALLHPLPPTFESCNKPFDNNRPKPWHLISVAYELLAILTRPPNTSQKTQLECRLPVLFTQSPSINPGLLPAHIVFSPKEFRVQTFQLVSNGPDKSLVRRILMSLFKSPKDLPTFAFTLTLRSFNQVQMGQIMNMSLSLKVLLEESSVQIIPTVSIKNLSVTIVAIVTLSATKDMNVNTKSSIFMPIHDTGIGQGLGPFTADANFGKRFSLDIFRDNRFVPTFSTPHVDCRYAMRVGCMVLCANKAFRMMVEHPLTILPGPASELPPEFEEGFGNGQLPGYER